MQVPQVRRRQILALQTKRTNLICGWNWKLLLSLDNVFNYSHVQRKCKVSTHMNLFIVSWKMIQQKQSGKCYLDEQTYHPFAKIINFSSESLVSFQPEPVIRITQKLKVQIWRSIISRECTVYSRNWTHSHTEHKLHSNSTRLHTHTNVVHWQM